jgi:hypothetical protein
MIVLESIKRIIDFNPTDVIDWIAPRPLLIIGNAGGPYDWLHAPSQSRKHSLKQERRRS